MVTVNPKPVGTANTLTINSGASVNQTLSANLSSTYSWSAADNPNVTGETTTTSTSSDITDVLINSTGTTQQVVYTVIPTSTSGCVGDAFMITVNVNPGIPTISINDVTVVEGNTAAFTVTLSNTFTYDVTFNINTSNGTAFVPGDYTAISGTLYTITAGQISTTVYVQTNSDNIYETDETFDVVLSSVLANGTSITTTDLTGVGTITNSTAAPVVSIIAAGNASEPSTNGSFTVNLTTQLPVATTVTYTVTGTATNGTDYSTIAISVLIPVNTSSVSIPVNVINDLIIEGTEDVVISLVSTNTAATITTVPADKTATVTIGDDDAVRAQVLRSTI